MAAVSVARRRLGGQRPDPHEPRPASRAGARMTRMPGRGEDVAVSRFVEFSRAEWARLRAATPLPLTEPQLRGLVSLNERTSLDEVADIYLPLSRLLNLYVGAKEKSPQRDRDVSRLGEPAHSVRHRRRGQRGGGEEHRLTAAAGAALAMAEPPEGGSDHDRRIPAAARDARGERAHASQGLSGELRRAPPGALHGRPEIGRARGAGAGVFTPAL